jgi:hypothetical protein
MGRTTAAVAVVTGTCCCSWPGTPTHAGHPPQTCAPAQSATPPSPARAHSTVLAELSPHQGSSHKDALFNARLVQAAHTKSSNREGGSSNMFLAQRGLTRFFPHSTACYTPIAAHFTSGRFQDIPAITCWTIKSKGDAEAGSVRCPRGRSAPRGGQWRCGRTGRVPCRACATAAGQRRGIAAAAAG